MKRGHGEKRGKKAPKGPSGGAAIADRGSILRHPLNLLRSAYSDPAGLFAQFSWHGQTLVSGGARPCAFGRVIHPYPPKEVFSHSFETVVSGRQADW